MKSLTALVLLLVGITLSYGRSTRIVGGYMAHAGDIPSIVSVKYKDGLFADTVHICGGTIVNDNHILTAASCVEGLRANRIHASAGDLHLHLVEHFQEDKTVNQVFFHPEYDNITKANNLAILRTSHNFVPVVGLIEAVPLPVEDVELPSETPLWVAGWGADGYESPQRQMLYINNMTYLSSEECATDVYGDSLPNNSACVVGAEGNGICDLDEGGPVLDASGVQVGIISWHVGCDAYPGVVMRTAPYVQWIQDHFDS